MAYTNQTKNSTTFTDLAKTQTKYTSQTIPAGTMIGSPLAFTYPADVVTLANDFNNTSKNSTTFTNQTKNAA